MGRACGLCEGLAGACVEVNFKFFDVFLILFSYVNFYDSGARSGRTGVFGTKASKKPRGSNKGEGDEDGEPSRKSTIPRAGS